MGRWVRDAAHVWVKPLACQVLWPCLLSAAVLAQTPAREFLTKPQPEAVRIMTWNIWRNSVFPVDSAAIASTAVGRPAQFARVVRAVQPDVMCLQELNVGAESAAALLNDIQPLAGRRAWHAYSAFDSVILSRFPVAGLGGGTADDEAQRRGHANALLTLPASQGPRRLYMTCAHFQSSDGPEDSDRRQREADMIVKEIRDLKAGRGPVRLPAATPFVILGDLNAIPGGSAFVDGLSAGDPSVTQKARPGAGLDWDGSALTDALPRHNGAQSDIYTWRNDLDIFPRSILDRFLYSDSVLEVVNSFVLDTTSMSEEALRRWRLRATDVMLEPDTGVHDHMPMIFDIRVRSKPSQIAGSAGRTPAAGRN